MKTPLLILFALAATGALAWQQHGPTRFAGGEPDRVVRTTAEPVVVYTMQACPYCWAALAYLDDIGQPYVNRDVERDPGAYAEYMAKTAGNPGVPVIDVGGRIMQGWSRDQLDALLAAN